MKISRGKMGGTSVIRKHFEEAFGLDLRSSALTRDPGSCIRIDNSVQIDGFQSKRQGFAPFGAHQLKGRTSHACAFYSPETYAYYDKDTGTTREELVSVVRYNSASGVGHGAFVSWGKRQLSFQYSGLGAGTFNLTSETGDWVLTIVDNAGTYNKTYGAGAGNGTPPAATDMLSQLRTDVLARAGWSVTTAPSDLTDLDVTPVSTVGPVPQVDAKTTPVDLFFYFPTEVSTTIVDANLMSASADWDKLGFVNPAVLNAKNCFYFCAGNYLMKYDGLRAYRAGTPQIEISGLSQNAAATTFVAGDVYIYKARIRRGDGRGNEYFSTESDDTLPTATTTIAVNGNSVTVAFDTASLGSGTFGMVSENVVIPHVLVNTIDFAPAAPDFKVGDKVYFYDAVTGGNVLREVTNLPAAGQITIDGAPVTMGPAIVSNNFVLEVYRTKANGIDFFLVAEQAVAAGGSQSITDTIADTALGADWVQPARRFDLPPKCSVMTLHQGKLALSGNPDEPEAVYWNDDEGGVEAFPPELSDVLPSTKQGPVTALVTEGRNSLAAFKETSYFVFLGDLETLNYVIETISDGGLGIVSQHTIQQIEDYYVGLSRTGPIAIKNNVIDEEFGIALSPLFRDVNPELENGVSISAVNATKFNLRRATSGLDVVNRRYVLFMPREQGVANNITGESANRVRLPGGAHADGSSGYQDIYVFDYGFKRNKWHYWYTPDYINMGGGMCIFKDKLLFASFTEETHGGNYWHQGQLMSVLSSGTRYDYIDNLTEIAHTIQPQWEDGGEPSLFKKLLRVKLFMLETDAFLGAFDVILSFYRDYHTTRIFSPTKTFKATLGNGTDNGTDFLPQEQELTWKAPVGKGRAFGIAFTNYNRCERSIYTGYALELSQSFRSSMKDRKGS